MNRTIYSYLTVLDINEIDFEFQNEFDSRNDSVKPRFTVIKNILHEDKQLHSLHKIEDNYVQILKCVEASFDISKFDLDKSLPRGEKEKNDWINRGSIR